MNCNPCQEALGLIYDQHYEFLEGVKGNWDNHRPLLLLALNLAEGTVTELGSGDGSTPYLKQYCQEQGRHFESFDNSEEWCKKTGAVFVSDWNKFLYDSPWRQRGVIFIDHAPGERRVYDAIALGKVADILVLHDTEEGGAGDYKWHLAWPHFKYRLNYNRLGGGAGATAVSNTIDLNKFRGLTLGQYKFDDD